MDAKKKLMELANDVLQYLPWGEIQKDTAEQIAVRMMDHGVTVQDGKTLEAFLHPIDAYKGLKAKYLVFKADTGEKVEACFVLRPDKDKTAVEALRAYAEATDSKALSEDIYNWVGKSVASHNWIPVTERLPEPFVSVLAYVPSEAPLPLVHESYMADDVLWVCILERRPWKNGAVTHWMPMPEPPEGE